MSGTYEPCCGAVIPGTLSAFYWANPILGPLLEECTRLVLAVKGKSAEEIFGYPDYLKFGSCMTLFAECAPDAEIFTECLLK